MNNEEKILQVLSNLTQTVNSMQSDINIIKNDVLVLKIDVSNLNIDTPSLKQGQERLEVKVAKFHDELETVVEKVDKFHEELKKVDAKQDTNHLSQINATNSINDIINFILHKETQNEAQLFFIKQQLTVIK